MTEEELHAINNGIAKIWLDAEETLRDLLKPLSDQEIIELANHWEDKIKSEVSDDHIVDNDDAADDAWVIWSEATTERRLQFSDNRSYMPAREAFVNGFLAGLNYINKEGLLPGGYWNFLNKIRHLLYIRRLLNDADKYMKLHPDAKMYCPFHKRHDCWDLHDD